MNNIVVIEKHINKLGLKVGSIDQDLNKLSKQAVNELVAQYGGDYTDIVLRVRGRFYVVECTEVDNEVDMTLYSKSEYLEKYGDEYEYKFEWNISCYKGL